MSRKHLVPCLICTQWFSAQVYLPLFFLKFTSDIILMLISIIKNNYFTSSIPATGSETPLIRPIQRITPKSGGSFTSTIEPTSSSPSTDSSPSSLASSLPPGNLSSEGGPWTPFECCSLVVGDVGLWGLGGGRGGRGRGFWVGFGGGSGGRFRGCLFGGIRAILVIG